MLLTGQAISLTGFGANELALTLLVLGLTRAPGTAGLVGSLRLIPYVLLCLPAGVLVDRWPRRRILVVCDAGRALLLASVPIAAALGHLALWHLCVVALAEGTLFTFHDLAAVAALTRAVPPAQLAAGTSLHSAATNGTQLVGPALGGLLFGLGRTLPLVVNAGAYALAAAAMGTLRRAPGASNVDAPAPAASKQWWMEVGVGLRWLWRHPVLRVLALLCGALNLALGAYTLLLVVAAQRLHASAGVVGLVLAAAGLGGVIGPAMSVGLERHAGFARVFTGAALLVALAWPLTAWAPTPLALGAVALATMACEQVLSTVQLRLRLALIPDALQARINGAYRLLLVGTQPLGLALVGGLLQQVGLTASVLLCAIFLAAVAGAAWLTPAIRHGSSVSEPSLEDPACVTENALPPLEPGTDHVGRPQSSQTCAAPTPPSKLEPYPPQRAGSAQRIPIRHHPPRRGMARKRPGRTSDPPSAHTMRVWRRRPRRTHRQRDQHWRAKAAIAGAMLRSPSTGQRAGSRRCNSNAIVGQSYDCRQLRLPDSGLATSSVALRWRYDASLLPKKYFEDLAEL